MFTRILLLFALSIVLPVQAQILATFETNRGDVVVELQYDKTPQAVANFVTLAEGTRSSLNEQTGAVRPKRYYAGETFYRVVNDASFKIAKTGSGTGTNSGGPGYKFRDEFHPDLKHDPYVLAMANGGPNTNGSQIYFTGSTAIPSLDGKHTVFGLVADPASRGVIDAILAAGNGATTIDEVTIQRNGAEAQAFDEFEQNLPTCSGVPGALSLEDFRGAPVTVYTPSVPLPGGFLLQVFKSSNLQDWAFLGELSQQVEWPAGSGLIFEEAVQPKMFYQIPLTTYPGSMRQQSLGGRTMVLGSFGGDTMTLQIDAQESTGSYVFSSNTGNVIPCLINHFPEAYGSTLILNPFPFPQLRIVCGYDSENATQIIGRHSSSQRSGSDWVPIGSGPLTLSK